MPNRKVLYFDIDGVFVDDLFEDKLALINREFEYRLKKLEFNDYVCLSTWSTIVKIQLIPLNEEEQKEKIYNMVSGVIKDKEEFIQKLILKNQTEELRCKHISMKDDWYYIDNQAKRYFTNVFDVSIYEEYLGTRILNVETEGDGSDIIHWLDKLILSTS